MNPPAGTGALRPRRIRRVETTDLDAIVIDVDATENEAALAVLQAPLHPRERGERIAFGYDLRAAGLGEWVGDRRLRLIVWPVVVDADGRIIEDSGGAPDADRLVLDVDPVRFRAELDVLARIGRLLIASPEGGPVPLVLDVDTDLVREVLARVTA